MVVCIWQKLTIFGIEISKQMLSMFFPRIIEAFYKALTGQSFATIKVF